MLMLFITLQTISQARYCRYSSPDYFVSSNTTYCLSFLFSLVSKTYLSDRSPHHLIRGEELHHSHWIKGYGLRTASQYALQICFLWMIYEILGRVFCSIFTISCNLMQVFRYKLNMSSSPLFQGIDFILKKYSYWKLFKTW